MVLADHGFSSFRFDLSGIGDSVKQPRDSMSYEERTMADVAETVSFLKKKQADIKIIIIGLCTGADLAHRAAAKIPEITGVIMLDGYGYPTKRFYLKRYAPILMSPVRLLNVIYKMTIGRFISNEELTEGGVDNYSWKLPAKSDFISDMEAMLKAGKKHLYIYTGGVMEYYNYENQFVDAFESNDFISSVQVRYFAASDHTYILHEQREKLFIELLDWLKQF